ncbi:MULTISPECIES: MFS transporter [unclassified Paenibacillus]|uniref:MFS transporter n=1 Tax=unclassified Paenibacillus TaxID=185978 RepID=UPI002F4019A5
MTLSKSNNSRMLLLMVNMFIAMLGIGLIIPVIPEFLREFNAGGKTAGYLIAAFGITQFICSPIAGELSDKYGRKLMIVTGLVLFTISNLVFAMADHVSWLYVSRLIGGVGAAAMVPAMLAYVADITTEEQRGRGLGLLGAAMSLGFVVGPGVGGFLAELGVRAPFYVSAGAGAVAMLGSLLLVPESLSMEARTAARAMKEKRENILKQFARSTKSSYFILLVLVFTLTFGLINFEAIFPLFVDAKFGYTTRQISIIITVGALAGVIIQSIYIGKLINRFGEKALINWTFLLSAVSLVLMLITGNFYFILIITTIFFTLTSIMRPAINTLLSKSAGEEQGFVAGMNNAYMSLGNILGPAVAGTIYDVDINAPYLLGAAVLVLSLFLSMSRIKVKKQSATVAS